MKRIFLWTAGIVIGLWVARELQGAGQRMYRRASSVDLNECSREELLNLPGMTEPMADRIIENRPYRHRLDLVARMVIPSGTYQNIREMVDVDGSLVSQSAIIAS